MLLLEVRRSVQKHLGVEPKIGAWCQIGAIPDPPHDVHAAAGGGRLRPAVMRPLGMLGTALAFPFRMLYRPLAFLDRATSSQGVTQSEHDQRKAMKGPIEKRDRLIVQQGLDEVFDGDWHRTAGQLLLRWYGKSSHHRRLLLLIEGRVVLMAPPKRVSIRVAERLRVMEDFPKGEAVVEDPLLDNPMSDRLRVRFPDGSWLILVTKDVPSDVHRWLRHLHELGDNADQASEDFLEEWADRHHRRSA